MKRPSNRRVIRLPLLISLLIALTAPLAACSSGDSTSGSAEASSDTPSSQRSDETVQVGVLVIRNIESTRQRYEPLINYLSDQLRRPVVLVPLTQNSQFFEVEQGNIDFVISNPLASVQIQRLYDTQFLATESFPETGTEFSGLIIVKSDSPIQTLEDLRGKNGACVSLETAAGGCLFQMYHLQEKGINPFLSFNSLAEIPSQNAIVQNVLNGSIDFGFIVSGQLDLMVEEGLIPNKDGIRVLEPVQGAFADEHTTQLYPTWPVAATSSASPQLVEAVKQALLEIPPDSQVLEAIGIEQYIPAVDYSIYNDLIEDLQLRSWDAADS